MRKVSYLSILFVVMLVAVAVIADAQQQSKVAKIGYLVTRSSSDQSPGLESFRREIRALGYIEGKNMVIEQRSAEGKLDRLPAAADELVRLRVDVIVTASTPGALAAKNATRTIPIVFTSVGDPVAAGLVDSFARPGENITGFSEISVALAGKRLELLKETIPRLSRVALLWNPRNPGSAQQWKESQLAGRELGLQLHSMEVSSNDKFNSAFNEAIKAHSAALAVTQDSLFNANPRLVTDLAAKHRLPAIYTRREFVESSGLMSYGTDRVEPYRRAAILVDKILRGAKPADLPVEQPTKFELVINLKTAKQNGLTIPPNVLVRADKVIK
jgi:putative tryptophan/tyrosine transport system substrate-binding protein